MNSEDYPVLRGVMNELLDHYLGFPERDWVAAFGEWNDKRLAGGVAALDAATAGEHEHTTPSLPLAQYAARYVDNWYGPIAITHDGQANGLRTDFLQSPNMAVALVHYTYDTFLAPGDHTAIEPAYAHLNPTAPGKQTERTR